MAITTTAFRDKVICDIQRGTKGQKIAAIDRFKSYWGTARVVLQGSSRSDIERHTTASNKLQEEKMAFAKEAILASSNEQDAINLFAFIAPTISSNNDVVMNKWLYEIIKSSPFDRVKRAAAMIVLQNNKSNLKHTGLKTTEFADIVGQLIDILNQTEHREALIVALQHGSAPVQRIAMIKLDMADAIEHVGRSSKQKGQFDEINETMSYISQNYPLGIRRANAFLLLQQNEQFGGIIKFAKKFTLDDSNILTLFASTLPEGIPQIHDLDLLRLISSRHSNELIRVVATSRIEDLKGEAERTSFIDAPIIVDERNPVLKFVDWVFENGKELLSILFNRRH